MSQELAFEQNNQTGQVWTPEPIALKMIDLSIKFIGNLPKNILDPAVGPTTFLKALHKRKIFSKQHKVLGYDIDEKFVNLSNKYLEENNINGEVKLGNYLLERSGDGADFIIMNPPYIRHERIGQELKQSYLGFIQNSLGVRVNGRSNLYIYFLLKSIVDLKKNGLLCAIIYDSIRHSFYGQEALNIIKQYGEILRIEDVRMPFDNALVDASILIVRKKSNGGIIAGESIEREKSPPRNFVFLNQLVNIKRGTGLLNTAVFMASPKDRYYEFSVPFIKKSVRIGSMVVDKYHGERAYLFDEESELPKSLIQWLEERIILIRENRGQDGLVNLLNIKQKYPQKWFWHPTIRAKIIFNYYIRSAPRHYLNPFNLPVADNFYAISPKGLDSMCAWILLNGSCYKDAIMQVGRPQGNGLYKIQVYEYKKAIVPDWHYLGPRELNELKKIALKCVANRSSLDEVTAISDKFIKKHLKVSS